MADNLWPERERQKKLGVEMEKEDLAGGAGGSYDQSEMSRI